MVILRFISYVVRPVFAFFAWLWNDKPHWPSGLAKAEKEEAARLAGLQAAKAGGAKLAEGVAARIIDVPPKPPMILTSVPKKRKTAVSKSAMDNKTLTFVDAKKPVKAKVLNKTKKKSAAKKATKKSRK